MTRELVSIKDAQALAGVSRRTIYHWMTHGRIDYIRTAGGNVRIYIDTLFRAKDGSPFPLGGA